MNEPQRDARAAAYATLPPNFKDRAAQDKKRKAEADVEDIGPQREAVRPRRLMALVSLEQKLPMPRYFTREMHEISDRHNAELLTDPVFAELTGRMSDSFSCRNIERALQLLQSGKHLALDEVRQVEFITQTLYLAVDIDNYAIAEHILTEPKYGVDASCCDVAPPWCIDRSPLLHMYIHKETFFHMYRNGDRPGVLRMRILPLLLEHGANVNGVNYKGETPLHLAAVDPGIMFAVDSLIKAGALCETKTHDGHTPMHYACMGARANGDQDDGTVRLLCRHGASPQARDLTFSARQTGVKLRRKSHVGLA
ncbi:hypothetical protein T484DRAFT_1755673 [Baffinella frigidus]|nr:hypothetical protein T484DRAFT_1755673 [Cryptophyta sp. CCMP2293]